MVRFLFIFERKNFRLSSIQRHLKLEIRLKVTDAVLLTKTVNLLNKYGYTTVRVNLSTVEGIGDNPDQILIICQPYL